ncbi:MAG: LysR substrate-binding domain-containing protein [Pseudomonadota bacterium]|nr:LysR substrate-binding domain-containing protein [Pseudomonadota bacterium]
MTLTELRYIVAVARERHFGRAAESCFVSQPTLSVAVRKLEEELGVALFERGRNEVCLTPVGERIVEQAGRVLEEAAVVRQIAQQGKDQLVGPLRVGAIYTIGPYLLPHLIPRLGRLAPEMPLVIEESYTRTLAERLKQGELDVILVSLPFDQPQIEISPLYDEPFVVVIPSSHRWIRRDAVSARELASENLLLLGEGHCFREQVLDACPGCGRGDNGSMQRGVEGSSLETIRHMVASGLGVTVLPKTSTLSAPQWDSLLAIRPFRGKVPCRRVVMVWRRSFPRPKAVEILRRAILDCRLPGVSYIERQVEAVGI